MYGFFRYPSRLNDLFADAVNVWLALGDPDALEIACNAAITAAEKQRKTMIYFAATADKPLELIERELGSLPKMLPSGEKFADLTLVRERQETLLRQIQRMQDVSLMAARRTMNAENEKVVRKADTSFLRSRYPSFPLWAPDSADN